MNDQLKQTSAAFIAASTDVLPQAQPIGQSVSDELVACLRQYQHNDCSGFVFGYDKDGVDRLVASLQARLNSQPVSGAMTDEAIKHKSAALKAAAALAHLANGVEEDDLSNSIKDQIRIIVAEVGALSQCGLPLTASGQAENHLCKYPLCQSETEQDRIADEVHAELYSGQAVSEKAVRDAALHEAIEACMRATPNRAKVKAIGEAAHYVACADAIRALASTDAQQTEARVNVPSGWREAIDHIRENIEPGAVAHQQQYVAGIVRPYLDAVIDALTDLEEAAPAPVQTEAQQSIEKDAK